MRPRLSIRRLLGVVALISLGLAAWRWNDPAVRYWMTGDTDSFYEVLKHQVKNGDPVEEVERLLGPPRRVTDPKHHRDCVSYTWRRPAEHPQGGEDRDVFFSYPAAGWNITLQARDGRLVNFDPTVYPLKLGGVLGR